jgi:hypothetical protein
VPLGVIAAPLGHSDTRMVEKHHGHLSLGYIADTVRAAFGTLGIGSLRTWCRSWRTGPFHPETVVKCDRKSTGFSTQCSNGGLDRQNDRSGAKPEAADLNIGLPMSADNGHLPDGTDRHLILKFDDVIERTVAKPLLGGLVSHPKLLQPRRRPGTSSVPIVRGLHGARKICH